MRHLGSIAFFATVGVLGPAALLHLDAGPEQRAKLFAPDSRSVTLDGTEVTASLDTAVVDQGGTVKLSLVAAKATTVGIVVMGTNGSEGERVPSPPTGVAHETVTLAMGPDGKAHAEVPLKLKGAEASWSPLATYTIYVLKPKAAARLERLRRNARPPIPTDEGIPDMGPGSEALFSVLWRINSPEPEFDNARDAKLFDGVARLEVYARPKEGAVTLRVPEHATRGEWFAVDVTVTNPTKKRLEDVTLSLETPQLGDAYRGIPGDHVETDAGGVEPFDLGPKQTKHLVIRVRAQAEGVVGLHARASCDECYATDSLIHGSFDAVEIGAAEGPAQVARTQ